LSFGKGAHYIGGFSPNGCEILFTWERDLGNADLFAARLDGSGVRQLMDIGTTGALSYRVWSPEWSPQGDRILFTLIRYYDPAEGPPYRTTHIAWVNAETGGAPNFYSNTGEETQPTWSPDGNYLVYVSGKSEPEPQRELWFVRADGGDKRQITNLTTGEAFSPRWSPDGQWLAFIYQSASSIHQIMTMPLDGSRAAQVLHNQTVTVLDYTWQTDSQGIVAALMGFQGIEHNTLWQLSLDASLQPTYMFPNLDPNYFDFPRYSSDGRWLAFRSSYQLAVLDTQTSALEIYPNTMSNNSPPVWSPSGFSGEAGCLN
jgi:Tol biopolymer transport system component